MENRTNLLINEEERSGGGVLYVGKMRERKNKLAVNLVRFEGFLYLK